MSTEQLSDLNEEQIKLISQLVAFYRLNHSPNHSPDFQAGYNQNGEFVINAYSSDNKQHYIIEDVREADFFDLDQKDYVNLPPATKNTPFYDFTLARKAFDLVPISTQKPSLLERLGKLPEFTKLLGILIPSIVTILVTYIQFIKPTQISAQFTQTAEAKQITQTTEAFQLTAIYLTHVQSVETETPITMQTSTIISSATLSPTPIPLSETPTEAKTIKPTLFNTFTPTSTSTKAPTFTPSAFPGKTFVFTPYPTSIAVISPNNKNALAQLAIWKTDSTVYSVAVSPNDNWVASGEQNGKVIVRDLYTGSIVQNFDYGSPVREVAFSENSEWLAAAGDQGVVTVWNTDLWDSPFNLFGHRGVVSSISFSPDGTLLASGSYDSTIQLWRVGSWNNEKIINNPCEVNVVRFSPDSKHLVIGSNDGIIRVLDRPTYPFSIMVDNNGPKEAVIALAFSPDGQLLVSGTRDLERPFQVWDFGKLKLKQGMGGLFLGTAAAFSSDGQIMVTGNSTRILTFWRTSNITKLSFFTDYHQDVIHSIDFSSDGKLMVTGSKDKTIRVWGIK